MRMCSFTPKIPTIWTIYDKNTNALFTKETFLTCKKTPHTRAKSNIAKNFVARNDEKVARRINATPDVTTRPTVCLLLTFFVWRAPRTAFAVHSVSADPLLLRAACSLNDNKQERKSVMEEVWRSRVR